LPVSAQGKLSETNYGGHDEHGKQEDDRAERHAAYQQRVALAVHVRFIAGNASMT